MIIFKSINTLKKEVNFKANIGFVPTMGTLHNGHISLIKSSKKKCKKTLVSIFINPSQFDKKKDLHNYPRNIKKDIAILKKLKVDYLLIPKIKDVYRNKKSMKVNLKKKDKILCALYRPGHFEGVLGVINQFLKKINSKYLFLGEKDYQQIHLIKKFTQKRFDIKIIPCETIRTKKFVPCSSRNFLLSKEGMKKVSLTTSIIYVFFQALKKNLKNIKKINEVKRNIELLNVKIEYFEIRNKINLSKKFNISNFKIFIAYYIENVRLIDNF